MAIIADQFVFIHVPKTGGTWAVEAMRQADIEFEQVGEGAGVHVPWNELPSDRFRFGFVRDPVTWYRSHWAHKKRHNDYVEPVHPFDQALRDTDTFEQFVERATQVAPGFLSDLYEYLLGPPGAIEFIGKYEHLADDLVKALRLTRVEFDETALRATPPANTANGQ